MNHLSDEELSAMISHQTRVVEGLMDKVSELSSLTRTASTVLSKLEKERSDRRSAPSGK